MSLSYHSILQSLCCLVILQLGCSLPSKYYDPYGYVGSNLGSDFVLTVHGGYGPPGTVIDIYKKVPYSNNQLWKKEIQTDGTVKLISKLGNDVQLTIEVRISTKS